MLKICSVCVMDGTAPEIVLTATGCNFCDQARKSFKATKWLELGPLVDKIKRDGNGKKYDILIGLSGGADSSTALDVALSLGLRPLAYSMDNGWNDPKADENIMRLVEFGPVKVPFQREVIDLSKFRELQSAFLRAGLINAEIPTDHVLTALAYQTAAQHGIKWIISGGNEATESIMPASWSYPARDLVHLKDVYLTMTGKKLEGLPTMSTWQFNLYRWWYGIKTVNLLDYVKYDRSESIKVLKDKYGYKDYGEKHGESIFTRWYQSFYLYEKFGIDKRKAHFSSLIVSGQMTRTEAMRQLESCPVYPRVGLEVKVLTYKRRSHSDFKHDVWFDRIAAVVRFIKRLWN